MMRIPLELVVLMCIITHSGVSVTAQEKINSESPSTTQSDTNSTADPSPLRTLSGEVVLIKNKGVTPPRILKSPDPKYPSSAKGVEGTVVLWLVVNSHGVPEQIKVQRSLGHGLDQSAVEAVGHWKFAPAMKDGAPVSVIINVEVNFRR